MTEDLKLASQGCIYPERIVYEQLFSVESLFTRKANSAIQVLHGYPVRIPEQSWRHQTYQDNQFHSRTIFLFPVQ